MIVTPPVLFVALAAKLSVVPVSMKSPATAGETADVDTVTVKASDEAGETVAVTVLTPPFSLIICGVSISVTTGGDSSSVIIKVTSTGASAPDNDTVPDTLTILSGESTALSTAVIFTVPVLFVALAAKLSVVPVSMKSPATAGETDEADTVTVEASDEAGETVAVTVLTPPFSLIICGVSISVTTGGDSSSVTIKVTSTGASAPDNDTVPDTRTILSGESTALSTAVIVTAPVLFVALAAKLSVVPASMKSPATAGETADVDTVTVKASDEAGETIAVTVLTPSSSLIICGVSNSVTTGGDSSSVIIKVTSTGSLASDNDTVPETRTILSGESTALSTAVIVTPPVLFVALAAKLSVVPVSMKSPATAGETADVDTFTVKASDEAGETVAVTVLTPPFSLIICGVSISVTTGGDSSSVIIKVTSTGASAPDNDTVPDTRTILSGESTALSTAVIFTVPVLFVALAAKLSVVPVSMKSPATAGETAPADTVTVKASGEAGETVAVTVLTPPSSLIICGVSNSVITGVSVLGGSVLFVVGDYQSHVHRRVSLGQ